MDEAAGGPDDWHKLYTPAELAEDVEVRLAKVTGTRVTQMLVLADDLLAELGTTAVGFPWLQDYPEPQRMLVGDFVVSSCGGVVRALRHAALHMTLHRRALERETERFSATYVQTAQLPIPTCPADELTSELMDVHLAGFARALGSTFDCLTVVCAGLLGLPLALRRASWNDIWGNLEKKKLETLSRSQPDGGMSLDAIRRAPGLYGPEGWLRWALDFRNMAIHRAWRMRMPELERRGLGLSLPRKLRPHESLELISRLPKHPSLTELESWALAGGPVKAQLPERETLTIARLLKSTEDTVHDVALRLSEVLTIRRANPKAYAACWQDQWPLGEAKHLASFAGYAPDSRPADPAEIRSNRELLTRLKGVGAEPALKRLSAWLSARLDPKKD